MSRLDELRAQTPRPKLYRSRERLAKDDPYVADLIRLVDQKCPAVDLKSSDAVYARRCRQQRVVEAVGSFDAKQRRRARRTRRKKDTQLSFGWGTP